MNLKKPTLLLAGFSAASLLAACMTTSNTPPAYAGCKTWEQQQAGATSAGATSMLSADLARFIGVQEVLASRNDAGLVAVQATVYNCSDVDVLLNVRTRFNGEVGQSEPPSVWKNVFLAPRGQATYTESALSRASSKVSVDINDGNRAQSQFAPGQSYAIPPK
jgi:hypothetical protein